MRGWRGHSEGAENGCRFEVIRIAPRGDACTKPATLREAVKMARANIRQLHRPRRASVTQSLSKGDSIAKVWLSVSGFDPFDIINAKIER